MAEPHTPENTRIGIQLSLSSGHMEVLVNDAPLFSPSEGLETLSEINTGLDFNTSVEPGRNTVTLRLRTLENGDGFERSARVRVLHWPAGLIANFLGDDVPFITDVSLVTREDGLLTISSQMGTQTSVRSLPVTATPQAVQHGEWITVTIPFDLDMPFQKPLWSTEGQPLGETVTIEDLLPSYRQIHSGVSQGRNGMLSALAPMVDLFASGYDWTNEQYFDHSFGIIFDEEMQFALQPIDTIGRQIQIYGDGRLATITPSPLTFVSGLSGETGELWLYFWKDQSGNWRILE